MSLEGLTYAQEENIIMDLLVPNTNINNILTLLHIDGDYTYNAINESLNQLIENYDAYRLRIDNSHQITKQYITAFQFQEFPLIEFSDYTHYENYLNEQRHRCVFDYNQTLYDFKIIKNANNQYTIMLLHHHLISDGWSMAITNHFIMKQLTGYETQINYHSYLETVKIDEQYQLSPRFERDRAYWLNKLSNYEQSAFPIPTAETPITASRSSHQLNKDRASMLYKICDDFSIGVSTLFSSLLHLYMGYTTNTNNNAISLLFHNRNTYHEKSICGQFARLLPFVIDIDYNASVGIYLEMIRQENFRLMKHKRYPFLKILADNKHAKGLSSCFVSYQNQQRDKSLDNKGFSHEWLSNDAMGNTLKVHLHNRINSDVLDVDYDFKTAFLNETQIEHMHESLMHILEQFYASYNTPLTDLEITQPDKTTSYSY